MRFVPAANAPSAVLRRREDSASAECEQKCGRGNLFMEPGTKSSRTIHHHASVKLHRQPPGKTNRQCRMSDFVPSVQKRTLIKQRRLTAHLMPKTAAIDGAS